MFFIAVDKCEAYMSTVRERVEVGSFPVRTDVGVKKLIVVSQEVVSRYDKEHAYTGKFLNLETMDGPFVEYTENENVFRLEDGTELRKIPR